jgi:hypothetical protein
MAGGTNRAGILGGDAVMDRTHPDSGTLQPKMRPDLIGRLEAMADYWDGSSHPDHKQFRMTVDEAIAVIAAQPGWVIAAVKELEDEVAKWKAQAEYAEARIAAGQRLSMAYEPSGSGEGRGPPPTGQGFGAP